MRHHVVAISLLVCVTSACGGDDAGDPGTDAHSDSFDRRALLANVATSVIVPALTNLEATATSMKTSVDAYCEAIGTAGEVAARTDAQAAWRAVMADVQEVEVLRLGPAAMNDNELRDKLYSWPLASSCAVDQDVKVRFDDPSSYDIAGRLTNRRGMDALEYALFSTNLDHTCPNPVAPEGWNELSDLVRTQARCDFAGDLATDILATTSELSLQWSPSGGNYIDDFSRAGEAASSFESSQVALNVLSDAMFFIEFEVKDIKLGEPAGITPNSCNAVGEACLEERESLFADHSKENVLANMRSFQRAFIGADGIGFDDMLIELGAPEPGSNHGCRYGRHGCRVRSRSGNLRDCPGHRLRQGCCCFRGDQEGNGQPQESVLDRARPRSARQRCWRQ